MLAYLYGRTGEPVQARRALGYSDGKYSEKDGFRGRGFRETFETILLHLPQ